MCSTASRSCMPRIIVSYFLPVISNQAASDGMNSPRIAHLPRLRHSVKMRNSPYFCFCDLPGIGLSSCWWCGLGRPGPAICAVVVSHR